MQEVLETQNVQIRNTQIPESTHKKYQIQIP